jgi:hypothetical protein
MKEIILKWDYEQTKSRIKTRSIRKHPRRHCRRVGVLPRERSKETI